MKNNKIFFKKKNKSIYFYFFIFFTLILIFIYIYLNNTNSIFFEINKNNKSFYSIPLDKKGKLIPNIDKKILDLEYNSLNKIEEIENNLNFTIQLFASSNFQLVTKEYNKFLFNSSFIDNDLRIIALNHNIGIEYLLIYKNFEDRNNALDHCKKYLNFIENCLIVNIKNLR